MIEYLESVSVQDNPANELHTNNPAQREKTVSGLHQWEDEVWVTRSGKKYGPYRRLRWRDANGKTRCKYLGRVKPEPTPTPGAEAQNPYSV